MNSKKKKEKEFFSSRLIKIRFLLWGSEHDPT